MVTSVIFQRVYAALKLPFVCIFNHIFCSREVLEIVLQNLCEFTLGLPKKQDSCYVVWV
jgi:hypothetical protein